ncbi:YkgJ family cysteine cluster protein [Yoonia sediminilitoris]|uniref:Putative zinc-or iron-chelating protein n=1 Tax=Yoonia sediminilitoris TaxID=1286148 RepID=A0A2T6KFY6_9RHOB|nr:YkgJ family cysteine cluster protein [Yoonia sediminilitoris]PUB14214.1 putative zinc- or iron-chelating protein [Yoonia sediminilitoris]RCW95145.1 putative zinc- or iron-chelating protein [Yoonia sediminilitoris]
MKPTSARAARRLANKAAKAGPVTIADLISRVERAHMKGVSASFESRTKRILLSYLQTAFAHGLPPKDVIGEMANGQAAWRLGMAVRDELLKAPPDAVRNAACQKGCAFCCILTGGEGGLITEVEAERLHAALAPLQGQPDGREWHENACPALDPATRTCRAYDARPMICRSFLSTDASACEQNAAGEEAAGAGLLASHLDYLGVQALSRQVLKGTAQVATYSLARTAGSAVEGKDLAQSLSTARHAPSSLDRACRDGVQAAGM